MRSAWSRSARGWMSAALLAAAAVGGPRPAAAETPAYPAPPGTRLVVADTGVSAPLDLLERHGFRVAVAIPPRLYYVIDTRALQLLPAGLAWA